jgi:hypothetical protein
MAGNLEYASEALNNLAHELIQALDAGAVVVLALVKDDDDEIAVAVGSTGLPHTTKVLGQSMPGIADELIRAADSELKVQKGFNVRVGNKHNEN